MGFICRHAEFCRLMTACLRTSPQVTIDNPMESAASLILDPVGECRDPLSGLDRL